jgi:hypothetical protein
MKSAKIQEENKKLVAELQEKKTENKTVSEVAKETATAKIRDIKAFFVQKDEKQLASDERLIVSRDARPYVVNQTSEHSFDVANTTVYKNPRTQQIEKLSQKICDALLIEFIKTHKTFSTQDFQKAFDIWGCAYGDIPRVSFKRYSVEVTIDALSQMTQQEKEKLCTEKKKLLLRANMYPTTRRPVYTHEVVLTTV